MVSKIKSIVTIVVLIYFVVPVATVGEKAKQACREYGRSMIECQNVIYPEFRTRVPVDLLLYPHMVLIGFQKNPNDTPSWKCGGSLISQLWVLTAAHCKEDPFYGEAKIMRIGTATFEFDEVENVAQERFIEKVVIHPKYHPPSKYHDIALIKAHPPFILNRDIRIACLQLSEDLPNLPLTAIGFGTTEAGRTTGSETLMKVDVDVIDRSICNMSMKNLIRRKVIDQGITEDQLCAGDYEHGGRDTCQGDSGGPLQYMNEQIDCENSFPLHTIVGVTSFGRDCGRKMAPGIYTKVSRYIDWIEGIVWPSNLQNSLLV